jgi:hypothetical protein
MFQTAGAAEPHGAGHTTALVIQARSLNDLLRRVRPVDCVCDVTDVFWEFVERVNSVDYDTLCGTPEFQAMAFTCVHPANERLLVMRGYALTGCPAGLPTPPGPAAVRDGYAGFAGYGDGLLYDAVTRRYAFASTQDLFYGALHVLGSAVLQAPAQPHAARLAALRKAIARIETVVDVHSMANRLSMM